MKSMTLYLASALALPPMLAAEDTRPVSGIMDNSFLVEEAYNQEAGVVQHITTAAYSRDRATGESRWDFSFTQEWPFLSQRHQLSYTLPYGRVHSGGSTVRGLGDVLLNYRYQAIFDEKTLMAFAPRVSLVVPSGNVDRGLGDGSTGVQVNLPFSTTIGDRWFVHLNAGTTMLPNADSADGAALRHYNAGASVIYAATLTTHAMLEFVTTWPQQFDRPGRSNRRPEVILSPGLRHAINRPHDLQIVLGLAAPIGLSRPAPDYGVYLYASFEHPFGH
jgi:hypothetical protein